MVFYLVRTLLILFWGKNPDANVFKVKENYNILLQCIPTEWKKYVIEKELKNDSFMADFCVNYKIQNIVFSTRTIKMLINC